MTSRSTSAGVALGAAILLLVHAAAADAQATPRIPTTDRVYADIDGLAALGLIDDMVAGQRPYSEREIARLLNEASANLDRQAGARAWAERTIAADQARWALPSIRVLEQASVTATELDSPFRAIPSDANGSVDASINPLVAYAQGRPYAGHGGTLALETRHSALLGRHAAVWINPRLTTFAGSAGGPGGTTATQIRLQSGAASFLFGNLSLDVGRDYEIFAQAPTGGIELSNDAPAFDAVQITNERPARLPGFLSGIGLMKATGFVADLGPHTAHAHSVLVGYKVNALVVRHFEFGFQVEDEMGGRGAPPASFLDRILDLVPPIDALRTSSDFQFSNKMAGIDLHLRLPSFAGLELYADGAVDDMDARRFKSSFLNDGGIVTGFAFSCLIDCGRTTLRAEYHQTGIRYYTHTQFPSGFATNHTLWGDPLGPRGLGEYFMLDHDAGRVGQIGARAAYEIRSGNLYGASSSDAHDDGFHFVQISHAPGETRRRFVATWRSMPSASHLTATAAAGYERVTDFGFTSGVNRSNWLGQVGFEWRPSR
jgi:hypothetical protein